MRRALLAAGVVVLAASLAACGSGGTDGSPPAGSGKDARGFVAGDGSITTVPPGERKKAPDVTGDTLDGGTFSLADHDGEVVVLNVWASWCAPCRAESPGLERLWRDVRSSGVQFVGVNVKDSEASARAFVRRFGLTYPSVSDQPGRVPLAFAGTLPPAAIPSTLVIDAQGRVAARGLGGLTETQLRHVVTRVRDETKAGAAGGTGGEAG